MELTERDIRAQLQRLLTHPEFAATPQRRAFLSYVVDEYLAGRAEQIKGVSIAMSVFGRDENFDQQVDPIVRLEARRLRQDIDGYYAGPGRDDAVRLSIPKGGYAPRFDRVTPPQAETAPELPNPVGPSGRVKSWRNWALAGFAGVVALSVAVVGLMFALGSSAPVTQDQNLPKGPVVAVLPFETLGQGPDYFANGITTQLTTELVRFRDLWVLPLGSVERFRAGDTDLQKLQTEFNADFALEGSVAETGDALRISARLIDLRAGRYVWVHSYSLGTTPDDIYRVQDRIIQDVIGKLAGKYGVLTQGAMQTAARTPPQSRDAYDCVLNYYSYQITIDLERHGEIKACIQSAVAQNPGYAEAWAVLSNLYLQQIRFGLGGDRQELLLMAKDAARHAVQIDPNLAAAHLMLANVRFVQGDFEGFRQAGQVAVDLNPNNSAVLAHYGMRLAFRGDWDAGLAMVDKAITLNPLHPHWYHFPAVFHDFDQGDFQQALARLDKIDMPNFFWTHLWRAALNGELGNREAAQEALRALLALHPDFLSNADDILSIWQLDAEFQRKLMNSLQQAGLGRGA